MKTHQTFYTVILDTVTYIGRSAQTQIKKSLLIIISFHLGTANAHAYYYSSFDVEHGYFFCVRALNDSRIYNAGCASMELEFIIGALWQE